MVRQRFPRKQVDGSADVSAALGALDADELRSLVGEMLERLDHDERVPLEDALLRRAAARGGFRPTSPSPALVGEVVEFAKAARRVGYADPMEVDEYLRRGISASLAEERTTARRIFEALLPPIFVAELGPAAW